MKIVHLCLGNFFIDNYSYQENMLPKYHAKQGHEVTIIASLFTFNEKGQGCYLPKPSTYQNENGCKVIRLAYKKPVKWNRFFRHFSNLYNTIKEEHPDIIFSHNVSYGDTKVVARYLKRHPEVKAFADNHADYFNSARNFLSKKILHPIIWRYYAKALEPYISKCYGVLPIRCSFLKEMYHINPDIVEYLPLGVDDDIIPVDRVRVRTEIRNELGIPKDAFVIFTGGKIDRLKNTHVLLDAINALNDLRIHLIICGTLTVEMEVLKDKIEFSDNIHYLGWCNSERVMNCMVASDLACFPGTHSTLWEQAVGVGLPAIFKSWDQMDHVDVNGNCRFVQGGDANELMQTISQLVFTPLYESLLERAGAAAELFSYSSIAQKAIVCQ